MKSVLTVFVFALYFVISGCDNDHTTSNDNNLDSIGAVDSPTSTGVITSDTAYLKDADTTIKDHQ
jgi:hypothetical protein